MHAICNYLQRSAVSETSLIYIRRSNRDEWSLRAYDYMYVCVCTSAQCTHSSLKTIVREFVPLLHVTARIPFPSFDWRADISERNDEQMHRLIVWKMQCSRYDLRMFGARYVVILTNYHRFSAVIPRATQAARLYRGRYHLQSRSYTTETNAEYALPVCGRTCWLFWNRLGLDKTTTSLIKIRESVASCTSLYNCLRILDRILCGIYFLEI